MPDRYSKFSNRAREILMLAQQQAHVQNCNYLTPEHFILGILLSECTAHKIIVSFGINPDIMRDTIKAYLGSNKQSREEGMTPEAKTALSDAIEIARVKNHAHVESDHLLLGILKNTDGMISKLLLENGISFQDVENAIQVFAAKSYPPPPDLETQRRLRADVEKLEAEFKEQSEKAGEAYAKLKHARDILESYQREQRSRNALSRSAD